MPARILVVANETCPGTDLHRAVVRLAGGEPSEVRIVAPALNGWVSTWANDIDGARQAAQERVEERGQALRADGLEAEGEVGDGNPLVAIEDTLRVFPAEAIVVSTHPPGRSRWLARSLVSRVEKRFERPVTHVIVDLEHDRVELREPEAVTNQ
jgi:GABA permease